MRIFFHTKKGKFRETDKKQYWCFNRCLNDREEIDERKAKISTISQVYVPIYFIDRYGRFACVISVNNRPIALLQANIFARQLRRLYAIWCARVSLAAAISWSPAARVVAFALDRKNARRKNVCRATGHYRDFPCYSLIASFSRR